VHELILGAELQQDEIESTRDFTETSRTNTAVFSQLRLNFGPADVQVSLRSDDNEAYGTNETGGVALGYKLDQSHRIRASYGTAFNAPTFNDLYWPGTAPNFRGNPDLKAEESESYELGVSGNYHTWFWDMAVYQMDVDNLITYDRSVGQNFNVEEAKIQGVEFSGGYERNGWRARASLTYMDPEDRTNDKQLVRRTKQTARFDLDKTVSNFTFGGSVIAEGDRYNDAKNNELLAGFATLDVRAGWRFAPNWSSRLTLVNALDKEYSTADGFNGKYISAGRTAMLSVRYDFQ